VYLPLNDNRIKTLPSICFYYSVRNDLMSLKSRHREHSNDIEIVVNWVICDIDCPVIMIAIIAIFWSMVIQRNRRWYKWLRCISLLPRFRFVFRRIDTPVETFHSKSKYPNAQYKRTIVWWLVVWKRYDFETANLSMHSETSALCSLRRV